MTPHHTLPAIDEDACLDTLAEMIRHKSYSETEGELALVRWTVAEMARAGIRAEARPVPGGRLNAIGRWGGAGGGGRLLFNGHLDTNPATEGWTVDPWGGVRDERFIYGIGVSNMKAGDAASLCAVRTLIEAGVEIPGEVILTYVVGELQGGIGTIAAIEDEITADCFVNSEPTDLAALTMHAGAFVFTIHLTGNTRHLSKREEGVDAAQAAAWLAPRINAMTFSGAASDEHRSINRAHVGVMRAALGNEMLEWRAPQVADVAYLKGSARYAPGQSVDGVVADMDTLLAPARAAFPGLVTQLVHEREEGRPSMPPFEVARDAGVVRALSDAYREVRGAAQPAGAIRPPAFYGTDAAHLSGRLGIPGVVCGPGGKFNTMPDERVEIADYLDMIRIYVRTILTVCAGAD